MQDFPQGQFQFIVFKQTYELVEQSDQAEVSKTQKAWSINVARSREKKPLGRCWSAHRNLTENQGKHTGDTNQSQEGIQQGQEVKCSQTGSTKYNR